MRYLITKLPLILLVIGVLIIVHHVQWSLDYKEQMQMTAQPESSIGGYAVVLISTQEKPLSLDLVRGLLREQKDNAELYVIDAEPQKNNALENMKVHYFFVSEKEIVRRYLDCLEALPKDWIAVHIDAKQKEIPRGLMGRLEEVFHNQSIWVVYADRRFLPSKTNPKWKDAALKAFHTHLVGKIHADKITTVEELHQSIYYLGNEHAHFAGKLFGEKEKGLE